MSEYRIVGRFQILGGHELSCIKNIGRAHVNTDTNCLEYRVDICPLALVPTGLANYAAHGNSTLLF